jgi:hypothetical protein
MLFFIFLVQILLVSDPGANNWYQRLCSCVELDPIYYTRRQKIVFDAMDPNVKLFFKEGFKQLRAEIKEGFAIHEAAFTKRLEEVVVADKVRDSRVAVLEQTATSFDKSFSEWKPEVESSISAVRLELSKLNSYFSRDAKSASSQSGVLQIGLTAALPNSDGSTDGPNGHRIDSNHRDCGFG